MSLAQKKMISMGFLVAALLAAIFAKGPMLDKLWIALVLLGLGLNLIWIRCPHCGCMLGRYSGEYCKMCGEQIDWFAKGGQKKQRREEPAEEIAEDELSEDEFVEDEVAEEPAEEAAEEETAEE